MPSDRVGNRRNRARAIRLDDRNRYRFRDNIGDGDRNDYFRLRLGDRSRVNVVLRGLRDDANIALLNRRGRTIRRSTQRGTRTERFGKRLQPGTYYLRVYPRNRRTDTRYVLKTRVRAIPEPPDSIQITSPNGSNQFEPGSRQTITWADNFRGAVRIDLYDGDTFVSAIDTSTASDGSYVWDIPESLSDSSNYKLKISKTNDTSVFDWSDSSFSIIKPPFVALTNFNSSETLNPGSTYTLTWDDNLSETVKIDLYQSGSLVSTVGNAIASNGVFDWTPPTNLPEGTGYQFKISSTTDPNVSDWSDTSLTVAKNGFNIHFDYRFDTNGWFTPTKRAALEAAADIWESIIQDEFYDVPAGTTLSVRNPQTGIVTSLESDTLIDDLVIFVGARDLGGPLGFGGPSGSWITGSQLDTRYNGNDFEPWTGSIAFNTNKNWFFDAGPLVSDEIPDGFNDFVSVAVHEMGHVLGIGSSDAFDNLIGTLNGKYYFVGDAATNLNRGFSIPLDFDQSHVEEDYLYNGTTEAALDPTLMTGTRKLPTNLDVALLKDIGYAVTYPNFY